MPSVPRVSIVIPTYNRAGMLPRAVNSVLAQTFSNLELLIVDDCSADNTPEVVAGFVDPRIRSYRHNRNRGLAAARNTGIANAQGQYIAFLDDDDEYLPTKLEKQVQALDTASPDVGLAYSWCSVFGPSGDVLSEHRSTQEGYVFDEALSLNLSLDIGTSSMIRASVIKDIGCFDEALLRCEDLDFLCRLSRQFKILSVPEVLVKLHQGHPQMTTPSRSNLFLKRDYIKSHIAKFRVEIGKRRRVRSFLWGRLALAELGTGNHLGAYRALSVAFFATPVTISRKVAKWLIQRGKM